jgi:Nucleotidyltransferase domain.
MRASPQRRETLLNEARRLAEQIGALGAVRVILFGSVARGNISLFSDIDLLALFDDPRSPRELTRWVYSVIDSSEGVDILAYSITDFERARQRPFWKHALHHSQVIYERPAT